MVRMSRTRRCRPGGSTEAAWSEPHMARSRVMCRSTKTAPSATAASVVCRPGLVAGVADRDVRELRLQGVDHPQVQLGRPWPGRCWWRGSSTMFSLPSTSTACRICFGVDMPVERMTVRPVARSRRSSSSSVSEAEATLWAGHVELLQEVDGLDVPRRGEPVDAAVAGVLVDLAVVVLAELDAVPVVDVGHPAPGGVALDVPLVARGADLRGALLELDGVAAGGGGLVDQREGVLELAVVVDADLAGDVDRVAGARRRGRRGVASVRASRAAGFVMPGTLGSDSCRTGADT